jgi:phosphoribosylformylglycinamidine cyclo-ligase
VVERDRIVDGNSVRVGDAVIGLPASGIHSNGFSLVRKILEVNHISYQDRLEGAGPGQVGDSLLVPTEIYASQVAELLKRIDVHAMAHITGGGLPENLPRVIPDGLSAIIDRSSWLVPRLFESLGRLGRVEEGEMFRTFNMGIGFVVVVAAADAEEACRAVHGAVKIGEISGGSKGAAKIGLGI